MPLLDFLRDYDEAAKEAQERQKKANKPMRYNPRRHK